MRLFGLYLIAAGLLFGAIGGINTLIALSDLIAGRGHVGMLSAWMLMTVVGIIFIIIPASVIRGKGPFDSSPIQKGKVGEYVCNEPAQHEMDGSPYTVLYTPSGRIGRTTYLSSLCISIPVALRGELQVTYETWFDKLCKRVGIASEIQTGDASFDSAAYIRSDTPAFASSYLTDATKRVAILDLQRLGFTDVTLRKDSVSVTWEGFNPERDDKPNLAADTAARLILLTRNLPPHQPEFLKRTGAHRLMWQVFLWLLLLGVALTILFVLGFPPIEFSELIPRAIPAIVVCLLGFGFVSAWLLRGTSTSHYTWSAVMLGALIAFPLGGIGMVAFVNGAMDSSPHETDDLAIVKRYTSTPRKGKVSYRIDCVTSGQPSTITSYGISKREYDAVVVGQSTMEVITRAGLLGVEWQKKKVVHHPKQN